MSKPPRSMMATQGRACTGTAVLRDFHEAGASFFSSISGYRRLLVSGCLSALLQTGHGLEWRCCCFFTAAALQARCSLCVSQKTKCPFRCIHVLHYPCLAVVILAIYMLVTCTRKLNQSQSTHPKLSNYHCAPWSIGWGRGDSEEGLGVHVIPILVCY